MPAIAREFDPVFTGHGCESFTILALPILNTDVFAEKQLLTQMLDFTIPHLVGSPPYCVEHIAPIWEGVPNVLCWFFPQAVAYSDCDAGFIIEPCAKTVFAGGMPIDNSSCVAPAGFL